MKIIGVRGGRSGLLEQTMLDGSRVILDWGGWSRTADLTGVADRAGIRALSQKAEPEKSIYYHGNATGQILLFRGLEPGDWIVLPRKNPRVVAIGKVSGTYQHDPTVPYANYVPVEWLRTDVPRSAFTQEQRYSLGAFMTFFRLEGKGFEALIRKLASASGSATAEIIERNEEEAGTVAAIDYEMLARDEIEARIIARLKGHKLGDLVAAILKAQGFEVEPSPEGPDGGIDVLAGTGALGLNPPRIAVQVKSGGGPVDVPTYNSLKGAMAGAGASQGLFVSWEGFKSTVEKMNRADWFTIRLWGRRELVDALFETYDKLDDGLRAEIPLRRIWIPVVSEG